MLHFRVEQLLYSRKLFITYNINLWSKDIPHLCKQVLGIFTDSSGLESQKSHHFMKSLRRFLIWLNVTVQRSDWTESSVGSVSTILRQKIAINKLTKIRRNAQSRFRVWVEQKWKKRFLSFLSLFYNSCAKKQHLASGTFCHLKGVIWRRKTRVEEKSFSKCLLSSNEDAGGAKWG